MMRSNSETSLRSSQQVRCLGPGCESLSESPAPGKLASTVGICNMEVLPGSRHEGSADKDKKLSPSTH